MNPKEFPWTEDQQVTVTNPTSEKYVFKVHSKEYEMAAGASAKMPGYMAWVYVYGLSTQMAQSEGVFNRWNEEGFRQEFYDRLVSGTDTIIQDVVVQKPLIEKVEAPKPTPEAELPAGGETYEPGEPDTEEEGEEEAPAPSTSKVAPMKPKAKALRGNAA